MNKTYPTNISGRIFYVDDNAYTLLLNYLNQLREIFTGPDGHEIVADIESRIAEIFTERIEGGATVITLEDVNRVIDIMGHPEDLSEGDVPTEEHPKEEEQASSHISEEEPEAKKPPFIQFNFRPQKRLFRNMQNKVLGGVIGGLATYLGWDATVMRILVVLLAFFTYVGPLLIIYLIAWMVIPPAKTSKQILEMHGEEINMHTIGRTVRSTETTPPPYTPDSEVPTKDRGVLSSILRFCVMGLMGFLGFISACLLVSFGVVLIACLAILIAMPFTDFAVPYLDNTYTSPFLGLLTVLFSIAFLIIPAIGVCWAAACTLFNVRPATKRVTTVLVILDVVFLILTIIFGVILAGTM